MTPDLTICIRGRFVVLWADERIVQRFERPSLDDILFTVRVWWVNRRLRGESASFVQIHHNCAGAR